MLLLSFIIVSIHSAKYKWDTWTFEDDGIEMNKLEIYNKHSGTGGQDLWNSGELQAPFTIPFTNTWS